MGIQLSSKKDYQDLAKKMLAPLKPYYSNGCAELYFGTHRSTHSLKREKTEAFIRPLWALAPLFAGSGNYEEFASIYLKGIINGTNPEHEEFWGEIESYSQDACEAPCVALALLLSKEKFFDPMTDKEKENVIDWLYKINDAETVNNNWNFFPILVNMCLKKLGAKYNQRIIDERFEKIEAFYKGDGWYSDGLKNRFDYYVPYAIHFYSLIYAKVMENDDKERSKLFKERAHLFAKHYIYFFDDTGREIPYGRSLVYRFAHISFWSACLYAGIEPFPLPVMKGIIGRNLRWWMDMPIFDNSGILTVGYGYQQSHLAETYTSYGSINWCLKVFLLLALSDEHPFWKCEEAPLPLLDKLHIIKEPNFVIQRMEDYCCLIPTGLYGGNDNHYNEKYSKFLYSSKHAFSISASYESLEAVGSDNTLIFEALGHYFVRKECIDYRVNDDYSVYSKWSPFEGVTVETTITCTENGHKRKHKITSDGNYTAYDCGFATLEGNGFAEGNGKPIKVLNYPNLNLYEPQRLTVNAIKYDIPKGETIIETNIIYPR